MEIIDSACSFHVCINKKFFSTYEPVQNGGAVWMGDNTAHKIVSMGTVEIKMHDDMVHTLTEVHHVATMSKNIISLSTLDINGYKYYTSGEVLKVAKGSLVVMR
jgi:hypothetical protein